MSQLTIRHRAAAVRETWSYREKLQRAVAARVRCQRLFQQLGITAPAQLAYAHSAAGRCASRLSG
jgi:hypothetical protein